MLKKFLWAVALGVAVYGSGVYAQEKVKVIYPDGSVRYEDPTPAKKAEEKAVPAAVVAAAEHQYPVQGVAVGAIMANASSASRESTNQLLSRLIQLCVMAQKSVPTLTIHQSVTWKRLMGLM